MNGELTGAIERLSKITEDTTAALPSLVVGACVFALFFLAGKAIRVVVNRLNQRKRRRKNIGLVLGRLAQGFTLVLGLLVAMTVAFPSFTPANLVQILGIGSVAIGFAFRDILQNYLAGILLLVTEPFRIGDQIIFGDREGTVEDVQTRATFIRTYDGRRVVIPNAELFTSSVLVNTAFDMRRSEADIGIGIGDDIDRAKDIMKKAMVGVPGVLREPAPLTFVTELGDFSVKIRALWWTEPPQRINILEVRDQVLQAMKEALIAGGVDLPYPTQQILFHDQTEEWDGDRRRQREGWPAGDDVPRPRHRVQPMHRQPQGGPPARMDKSQAEP